MVETELMKVAPGPFSAVRIRLGPQRGRRDSFLYDRPARHRVCRTAERYDLLLHGFQIRK